MTKPPATAEASQNSGASSILVWNGLVTTIRRIGGKKRNWARVDVDRSLERGREANASGEPKERWGPGFGKEQAAFLNGALESGAG